MHHGTGFTYEGVMQMACVERDWYMKRLASQLKREAREAKKGQ